VALQAPVALVRLLADPLTRSMIAAPEGGLRAAPRR
jgi:hypothetical protein